MKKIILSLLVGLSLVFCFGKVVLAEPSDDDNRVKGIQPVVERINP